MLTQLPDTARIWIFQADRVLSETEIATVRSAMNQFIPTWAAHGKDLYGGFEVAEKLFLLIGVDESKAPPSGCSIDKMMHTVEGLGKALHVDFLNRLITAFVDAGAIRLANQAEFRALIRQGKITPETIVFNNLVQTKSELAANWKTKVENSWHKALLATV